MQFSNSQIDFFNSGQVLMLTILQDDMPITLPIWGMIYKNAVYMATDSASLKIDLIRNHPKISATVVKSPPGWPWLRIEGTAKVGDVEEFSEFSDLRDVVERIAINYVPENEVQERFQGDNWTIIRIDPLKIAGDVDS